MVSFMQSLHPRPDCPASKNVRPRENSSLAPGRAWRATLLLWIERSRQRRALSELAMLNDHLLKDVGLTQEQARREAPKPFWQQ
jgi:uncharacterized protein YjiS (DUF1127 family)